jgi:hypothetical protein
MQIVKAKSSKFINDNKFLLDRFEWQVGYGVFSYSKSHVNKVYKYIANQEEHHRKQNFKEEYLANLNALEVSFDERYVFEDLQ